MPLKEEESWSAPVPDIPEPGPEPTDSPSLPDVGHNAPHNAAIEAVLDNSEVDIS